MPALAMSAKRPAKAVKHAIRVRDAKTGRFVEPKMAKSRPATTITERVKRPARAKARTKPAAPRA